MRTRLGLLALMLSVAALGSVRAEAALVKMRLRTINITDQPDNSPDVLFTGAPCCPEPPFDSVFIDDGTPGAPALTKLAFKSNDTTTVQAGRLGPNAHIFLSNNFLEGPGPLRKPTSFTGTGSTADASSIVWGTVTGWTITGAQYCQANPPVICALVPLDGSETTSDPLFHSDFYDLGTWTFHGTGFTSVPFVHQYFTSPPGNVGNNQRWLRAHFLVDATVPALPLLGAAALGGGLVAGGLIALRRRREP